MTDKFVARNDLWFTAQYFESRSKGIGSNNLFPLGIDRPHFIESLFENLATFILDM